MPKSSVPTLKIKDLRFSYDDKPLIAIDEFSIADGEQVAVIGPSGCGKSTFMHLIAGLLKPQSGTIEVQGKNICQMKEWEIDKLRGSQIGIVFQRLHLVPAISVLDNLLLAQRFSRSTIDKRAATTLLDRLGISDQAQSLPGTLSQGQAQRAAIARAIIHKPNLVIGDEPTSALDDNNAAEAIELLKELSEINNFTLLIITHDQRVRAAMNRVLDLEVRT